MTTKLSPKAQASIDKMIKKFEDGDLSPIVKVAMMEVAPDAPCRNWSFSNQLMAFMQTGSLDCRGFKQWKKEGRKVTSKAGYILGPRMITVEDEDGNERKQCIGFFSIPVFGVDGTEGDQIPAYEPKEYPPLMHIADKLGCAVSYQPLLDAYGSCRIDGTLIKMATDDHKTFFHELAHLIHGKIETLKGGQDPRQETIAEFTAVVLMEMYGFGDRSGNAWRYIKRYYPTDTLKGIKDCVNIVGEVLAYIEELA